MDQGIHLLYFLIGAMGGLCLEVIRLWEAYGKLGDRKFKRQFSSYIFWILVTSIAVVSGFTAWVFFADRPDDQVRYLDLFLTGVAARSIIRSVLASRESNKQILGSADDEVTMRDLLL